MSCTATASRCSNSERCGPCATCVSCRRVGWLVLCRVKSWVPFLDWLPRYSRKDLSGDLPAGLTVGVLLIPQGMAYATIAGLPVVYGLYAALVPQVVYALLGTSRQLAVGPAAMDSLLVASGLAGNIYIYI